MLRRTRLSALAFVTAALAALAPAVAHAAPAADDFDSATEITSLPLTTTTTTSGSTKADDDPNPCNFWGQGSVWLKYTATSDKLLRATARKSSWGTMLAVYTGQRGALALEPAGCVVNDSYTVHAKAGTTYYFMLVEYGADYGGDISFALHDGTAEANDNQASATTTTVPSDHQGDLSLATAEPGEVPSSCDATAVRSVWYRYTPTSARYVQVTSSQAISVHRATDLSEVDCVKAGEGTYGGAVFNAAANQTYLVRLAAAPERAGRFTVALRTAPPISPYLSTWPGTPNVVTDTTLGASAGDPISQPVATGTIDLGDGTVIPVTGGNVTHRFTKDGDYRVTTTVTTTDGRTGSTVRTLKVETHDVSVAALTVPASARAGQTKQIKASIANIRRDDNVLVTLYRSGPGGAGEREIGRLTQLVVASPDGRTEFPFAYTYSPEDAVAGQVQFRVRAEVLGYGWAADDKGDDNEARATTASVKPAAAGSSRAD